MFRLLCLALLLAGAGCLHDDLLACGTLECAPDAVCINNELCATHEQLAACDGLADGTLCVSPSGNGTCVGGVCMVDRCGDGIVDPGEVCDDGNLASGDGCRQDCRSDESCGNGVLDVAETCDCGRSDVELAPGCPGPNSDDPTALCDPMCSRRCGDNVVTGSEQCDGSAMPIGCTAFGFYSGTPGCTPYCAVDTSTCSGRCGDGVVDAAHGEVCDGSTPPATCVDYGRDYGVLGCGAFCGPDIANTCRYFQNWVVAYNATYSAPHSVTTNAHGVLAVRPASNPANGLVGGMWNGASILNRVMASVNKVTASESALFAVGASLFASYDGSWHDYALALGTGTPAATPTRLYVIASNCTATAADLSSAAVVTIASPTGTACATPLAIGEDIYVAAGAAGVQRFRAGSWTTIYAGATTQIYRGRTGHLLTGSVDIDVATLSTVSSGATVMDADGTVADITQDPDSENFILSATAGVATCTQNGDPQYSVEQSIDGALFSIGKGIYRLEPGVLTVAATFPSNAVVSSLTVLPDGALGVCGSSIGWHGAPALRPFTGTCLRLAGDPRGAHYMLGEDAPQVNVYRWDGGSNAYVVELANASNLVATATDVFASSDVWRHRSSGGTWDAVAPSGCSISSIGTTATRAVAAGYCATATMLWEWDGSSFVTIAQLSGSAGGVSIALDGTIYLGSAHVEGTMIVQSLPTFPYQFVPLSITHAFALDGVAGNILDYDGGVVSKIRASAGPMVLTNELIYYWDPTVHQIYAINRIPSRYTHTGL